MNVDELWNGLLELVAAIIIPVWNDLIKFLPLLVVLGVLAAATGLAWWWQRHAASNRSRVPAPIPAGRQPQDMHLPGPSAWPLVAPVGLLLIAFAVVFGPLESLANLALLGLGATIAIVGILGWYLDAKQEYVAVEAGHHGSATATTSVPSWSLAPPAGMHLPGPSAWPFLAPVGLLFIVAGLIFGPAMLVGGLVMAIIAVIGWLVDAKVELDDVEEHGHPSQADRDPEKAWPRRLIPVYFIVGVAALGLTLLPWLLSLLPGSG